MGNQNPGFNKRTGLAGLGKQGERAVGEMSATDLATLYHVVALIPQWRHAPAELAAYDHLRLGTKSGNSPRDILPGATYVESGTTYTEVGLAAVIAANDAAQVADIAVEITPDSALEGAPDPLRIAAVAISKPLDLTATGVQNAHDLYSECSADQQGTLIQSISDNLATDTTSILTAISTLNSDLDTSVTNIRSDISTLKSDLDTSVTNIRSDISAFKADMDTRLTTVVSKIDGVQGTLDTTMELRQIHIQVVTPPGGRDVLVSTTEGGQPITATLVSIKVASAPHPLTFTDMTGNVTTSAPTAGVLDVTFPNTNATNTVFQIVVKETSTIDGASVTHYGTILVNQQST